MNAQTRNNLGKPILGEFKYEPGLGSKLETGYHTITVMFIPLNSKYYKSRTFSIQIEVEKCIPELQWIQPNSIEYGARLDYTHFQCSCIQNIPGTFEYSHSIGTILEVGRHRLSLAFIPHDKKSYKSAYASQYLIVTGLFVPITWDPCIPILYQEPVTHRELNARSSDPAIKGTVTFNVRTGSILSQGEHILHATFIPEDLNSFRTTEAVQTLTVLRRPPELHWVRPFSLYDGEELNELTLNCACVEEGLLPDENGMIGTFEYFPGPGTILTVGSHTLRAVFIPSASVNSNYGPSTTTTQIEVLVRERPFIHWSLPAPIKHPEPLSESELNARSDPSCRGVFTYSPPWGTVLDVGTHTLHVSFKSLTRRFLDHEEKLTVEVIPGLPALLWGPINSILEDDGLTEKELNCKCDLPGGRFEYDPRLGTVLPTGVHTLHVTYFPENSNNYQTVTMTNSILVKEKIRRSPVLLWDDKPNVTYPTPLRVDVELNCICREYPGSFIYTPPPGTILPVGQHRISVQFTASQTGLCHVGQKSIIVSVNKGQPTLTWSPLSDFDYGTSLGSDHLNAHVKKLGSLENIEGTYEYDPQWGTVLDTQEHVLKCKFTPRDDENLLPAEMHVTVRVHRVVPTIEWTLPTEPLSYPGRLNKKSVTPKCLGYDRKPIPGSVQLSHSRKEKLRVGTHTLKCVFQPTDIVNFYSAEAIRIIEVVPAIPEVTWLQNSFRKYVYGVPLHLDDLEVSSNIKGSWIFDPPEGSLLTVGKKVPIKATFIPTDSVNYERVESGTYLHVIRRPINLIWKQPDFALTYGEPLDGRVLRARLSTKNIPAAILPIVESEGQVIYTPPAGTILNAATNQRIHAVYSLPSQLAENYEFPVFSIYLHIFPAQAPIVWEGPTLPLPYGVPLRDDLLNATCPVCTGTFSYDPPAGTVLGMGSKTIAVTFEPDDPNYVQSAAYLRLNVVKGE